MSDARYTGGCLCGALRYEATGEPDICGHCYCADCRKASGSGFIPFMGFPASALRITGETRQSRTPSFRGGEAVRNHCAKCGSLVFGGILGEDDTHTVYAGSLDDASRFKPTIAIFLATARPGRRCPRGWRNSRPCPDRPPAHVAERRPDRGELQKFQAELAVTGIGQVAKRDAVP